MDPCSSDRHSSILQNSPPPLETTATTPASVLDENRDYGSKNHVLGLGELIVGFGK